MVLPGGNAFVSKLNQDFSILRAEPSGKTIKVLDLSADRGIAASLLDIILQGLAGPIGEAAGLHHLAQHRNRAGPLRDIDHIARFQQRIELRLGSQHAGIGGDRDPAHRLLGAQFVHKGLHGCESVRR